MSDYAKSDLTVAILEDMSVLPAGQTPVALDQETVEKAIDAVYQYLIDEELMIFDYTVARTIQVIPARLFHALVDLVVDRVCTKYGLPRGVIGQDGLTDKERSAMKRLRRSILSADNGVPVQGIFY